MQTTFAIQGREVMACQEWDSACNNTRRGLNRDSQGRFRSEWKPSELVYSWKGSYSLQRPFRIKPPPMSLTKLVLSCLS